MGDTLQRKETNKVRDHIGCGWSNNMKRKHPLLIQLFIYADHNLSIICSRVSSKQTKKFGLNREERTEAQSVSVVFRFVFGWFRFNQNTKTGCFYVKQPKQTFGFRQYKNQFRFQYRLFQIETSFEEDPSQRCGVNELQ